MKKMFNIILLILVTVLTPLVNATDLIVTKSFTGGWYDPAKNGQGFLLEIINSNNQKKALATWFTFDNDGNQFWLIGVGNIQDQSITFQMTVPQGGRFGDLHNANNITNTSWGEVKFTFVDCNNGTVSWSPVIDGFTSGTMPVTRSTLIHNLTCTGGLFDELGDTLVDTDVITPLTNTGLDFDASGKTKYEQRSDRIDFSVEIEDLATGTYQLYIENELHGEIQVSTVLGGSTEGEIEFRDPVEPGKFLLDFDPRGKVIDIIQNNMVYLTNDGSGGGNGGNTSQNAPPFGDHETELYMLNTGVVPLGKAKTKLKQRNDRVDFQIELEDVPLGYYDFNVDGAAQGIIEVVQTPAGREGELEFRNPVEAGKELLDFNPLGAFLTVTQGADVLFTVNFPSSPGDNGGGNNGGGSSQNIEIEVDFTNSGVDSNASGSVEYEVRSDRRDFKVEVEDLEQGSYQLLVGGQLITTLVVSSDEVEIEFRDPVEPGKLLLDFDPLNQLVEIKRSGVVYLSAFVQ